jgi:hypothetical protein
MSTSSVWATSVGVLRWCVRGSRGERADEGEVGYDGGEGVQQSLRVRRAVGHRANVQRGWPVRGLPRFARVRAGQASAAKGRCTVPGQEVGGPEAFAGSRVPGVAGEARLAADVRPRWDAVDHGGRSRGAPRCARRVLRRSCRRCRSVAGPPAGLGPASWTSFRRGEVADVAVDPVLIAVDEGAVVPLSNLSPAQVGERVVTFWIPRPFSPGCRGSGECVE